LPAFDFLIAVSASRVSQTSPRLAPTWTGGDPCTVAVSNTRYASLSHRYSGCPVGYPVGYSGTDQRLFSRKLSEFAEHCRRTTAPRRRAFLRREVSEWETSFRRGIKFYERFSFRELIYNIVCRYSVLVQCMCGLGYRFSRPV